jgi:hypothetical protein
LEPQLAIDSDEPTREIEVKSPLSSMMINTKEKSRESDAKLNPLKNSIQITRGGDFDLEIKGNRSPGVHTAENSQEELSPNT